jgi:hypothetical protein
MGRIALFERWDNALAQLEPFGQPRAFPEGEEAVLLEAEVNVNLFRVTVGVCLSSVGVRAKRKSALRAVERKRCLGVRVVGVVRGHDSAWMFVSVGCRRGDNSDRGVVVRGLVAGPHLMAVITPVIIDPGVFADGLQTAAGLATVRAGVFSHEMLGRG